MKNIIYFICSIAVLVVLAGMACLGLSGVIAIDWPDFIYSFAGFYGIFAVLSLETFLFTLPLIAGIVFSIVNFSSKGYKIIFLVLEIIFLVIIFLYGFGVLPR